MSQNAGLSDYERKQTEEALQRLAKRTDAELEHHIRIADAKYESVMLDAAYRELERIRK